ncbi:MAG: 4-hydroxy-tetrahydrodipicolinate reductase [Candidatus Margulisbacteria bacterium]|nr:4-hydroxy-tetrahydrodipicolinate reductase [Candidatus Margulisiibacteriota bacterium]
MTNFRVMVIGAKGNMGKASVQAIENDADLTCVAQCDIDADISVEISEKSPDVVLDFTHPSAVFSNASAILAAGKHAVIGTTGLSESQLADLDALARANGVGILVCPNFAIGAVLMMQFSAQAAKYLNDVEIIEYHHPYKADAPSGTAIKTADMIHNAAPTVNSRFGDFKKTELIEGAKGGVYKQIPIHSVRLDSYIASQEVLFGSAGQRLTIRHDSMDRMSFMPGVCLALKKASGITGLVYGLENLL